MFRNACSAKFHIPLVYRGLDKAHKGGPVRVCLGCTDLCLEARKRSLPPNSPTVNPPEISSFRASNHHFQLREICPPSSWDESSDHSTCVKCKKGGKSHICRCCGKSFCSKCTSKMNIPAYFDKKGKTGALRVCDFCRYKVVGGFKLVERFSDNSGFGIAPNNSTSPKSGSQRSGGINPPPIHNFGSSTDLHPRGGVTDDDDPNLILIRWEDQPKSIAGRIAITSPNMTLKEIDTAFRQKHRPSNSDFVYLFKNQPIVDSFFDVFDLKKLGRQLTIRGNQEANLAKLQSLIGAVQEIKIGSGKNPFKQKDNEAEQQHRRDSLSAAAGSKASSKSNRGSKNENGSELKCFRRPSTTFSRAVLEMPPISNESPSSSSVSSTKSKSINVARGNLSLVDAPIAMKNGETLDDLFRARSKFF